MSGNYIINGESVNGTIIGAGQSLTILPGGSISGSTITGGGVDSVYGTAESSVVQALGVEYVFTGGISYNASLTDARQILEAGTAPDVQLTVQGGNAPVQTFLFTSPDDLALAQEIANNINAQPAADVQTYDSGGTNYTAAAYVLVNGPAADGVTTVVSTSATGEFIFNSTGAIFFGAAGSNFSVAAAGGNNTIGTGDGSTYDVATGAGNDLIFGSGSGSVDAGAGTNEVILGTGINVVTSYGTGDSIVAGSGAATISEGGTGGLVEANSSSTLVVADSGTDDTIFGGTGADTMFGGQKGTYFLGTASNIFVASTQSTGSDTIVGSSGGNETVFGGTNDVVFANSSTLIFVGTANGHSTISAGSGMVTAFSGTNDFILFDATTAGAFVEGEAGNSTINASPSTAPVDFVAGGGAPSIVGGSGDDTFFGGTGSSTFTGGGGDNTYVFIKGETGGTTLITDFKAGDSLVLDGYGAGEVANALATATTSANGETITLADNTKVTFTGDPTLNSSNISGFAVPVSGQGGTGHGPKNVFITNDITVLPPVPDADAPAAPLPSTTAANGTAVGTVINSGGEQDVANGSVAENTLINQGGVEYVSAGGFTDNATIAGGAMSLAGGADATTQISFAGAGSLSLAGSVFNTAPIAGFTAEDSITLSDIAYDIGGSVTMNDDDTALVIREGGQQYDLAFNGADGETFALQAAADGDSSTITENVLCYLRGTKILTPAGERAIEDLAIGDLVVTLFGGLQRINWIGRQSYDARFLRRHRGRIPVAIHPGALGENLPHRTLFVSPGHSMLIDGLIDGLVGGFAEDILVLARSLVNGITITQSLDDVPAIVEYFQVELDHHDCILAEGTWSETYADAPGMRAQFHNAAEYTELYPDAVQPDDLIPLCAPRPLEGPVLEAALRPLITHATAGRRHGALDGYIEVLTPSLITGWAIDITAPDLPLLLTLHAGDTILGTVLSCAHRADLLDAGKGNGNHGFAFTPAVPLDLALLPHVTISCAGGEVLPLASGCMVLAA